MSDKTLEGNRFDVVTYMSNRYGTCFSTSCGKEFWFMIKELIQDEFRNELTLKCAVCGFNGSLTNI